MPRRYYKRTRYNRDKYSVENTSIVTPVISDWTDVPNGKQWAIDILSPTDTEGMRKVKHITLSFSNGLATSEQYPLYYALVYVPQGYDVNTINIPLEGQASNLYEPNQFVMSTGVLDFGGGPLRIRTPLSRNLNSGDRLSLALALPTHSTANGSIYVDVRYAITLQ